MWVASRRYALVRRDFRLQQRCLQAPHSDTGMQSNVLPGRLGACPCRFGTHRTAAEVLQFELISSRSKEGVDAERNGRCRCRVQMQEGGSRLESRLAEEHSSWCISESNVNNQRASPEWFGVLLLQVWGYVLFDRPLDDLEEQFREWNYLQYLG